MSQTREPGPQPIHSGDRAERARLEAAQSRVAAARSRLAADVEDATCSALREEIASLASTRERLLQQEDAAQRELQRLSPGAPRVSDAEHRFERWAGLVIGATLGLLFAFASFTTRLGTWLREDRDTLLIAGVGLLGLEVLLALSPRRRPTGRPD